MKLPRLRELYYHHDYDGVVAAAMVVASAVSKLQLKAVQYGPQLHWLEQPVSAQTGIVDFLYHPQAGLWVDHHATTFGAQSAESFRSDACHVFEPNAPSCPNIIVQLPWFIGGSHWAEFVRWADVIDGAGYESAEQANDLSNPHLLLSQVIVETSDDTVLALLVREMCSRSATELLQLPQISPTASRIRSEEARLRAQLTERLRIVGQVALLDQSDLQVSYRRYLAYEQHPDTSYGIGLYRSGEGVIVSVGENPWHQPGPVHLGALCREYGGGGRRATAGVPTTSMTDARALAETITVRLNTELGQAAQHDRLRIG